ncbi:MAG: aldehyde dehydrogenase family protein [Fimbriimonadaceae bacterium]|nr:aldehyde dehydrogenase family protein [Fimbriimonadaceae bacterium]
MLHRDLLVAGRLVKGTGVETVFSPWDGREVGTVAVAGPDEVESALASAAQTAPAWGTAPVRERQALLRRVAQILRDRADEWVQSMVEEIGKPVRAARGEILRASITFDLAADELTRPTGVVIPADFDPRGDGVSIKTGRFPVGVVLCITPYNWPFNLAAHKVAAALAAGNTVVVKSPSLAPFCGQALAHILDEAGCPPGVAQILNCDNTLAERIVRDDRVAVVSFTGSLRVGRHIQATVPHKKVLLELGGDAYVLVGPDADLDDAAARTVASAYGYAGQVCVSTQHVRCHEAVYGQFVEVLTRRTDSVPTGDPALDGTVCGPLVNVTAADRVMEWVEEAESVGARVLAGGHRVGNTVWPALLADVPGSVRLATEEVFGPVATVAPFGTWSEAFAMVNASRFGLQAGVFTRDLHVAEAAFHQLRVGGVVVNDAPSLRFDNMPYGGDHDSGNTREGVRYAMAQLATTRVQLVRSSDLHR